MIYTIFSIDQLGGFGHKGSLPWDHDPEDMGWFREHTLGHTVVMGRNTWDDPKMPKPLPDRENCVISSSALPDKYNTVKRFHKNYKQRLVEMSKSDPEKKIFILGGPGIIMDCLDIIDWAYVTHRKGAGFYTEVNLSINKFLESMTFRSCRPSKSGMLNFCTYKNNNTSNR